jgi:hypothetical protein
VRRPVRTQSRAGVCVCARARVSAGEVWRRRWRAMMRGRDRREAPTIARNGAERNARARRTHSDG